MAMGKYFNFKYILANYLMPMLRTSDRSGNNELGHKHSAFLLSFIWQSVTVLGIIWSNTFVRNNTGRTSENTVYEKTLSSYRNYIDGSISLLPILYALFFFGGYSFIKIYMTNISGMKGHISILTLNILGI